MGEIDFYYMKTKKLLFLIIFSLILLISIGSFNFYNKNYVFYDSSDIFSKIDNNENGVYIFYFKECPWCKEIIPEAKSLARKRKIKLNLIDIHNSKFAIKDRKKLQNLVSKTGNGNTIYVPFILKLKHKKIVYSKIGLVDPRIIKNRKNLINKKLNYLFQ